MHRFRWPLIVVFAAIIVAVLSYGIGRRNDSALLPITPPSGSTENSEEVTLLPSMGAPHPAPSSIESRTRHPLLGLSATYPETYYISSAMAAGTDVVVRINKTADAPKIKVGTLDTAPFIELVSTNDLAGNLHGNAQIWGEQQMGSRFRTVDSCQDRTFLSAPALSCTFYAGTVHGGYRKVIFVNHGAKLYRFNVGSAMNNDPIQRDFDFIVSSIRWD